MINKNVDVEITNIDELKKLIALAQSQSNQLKETLDKIENFKIQVV
ncbi:hypothetical protein [Enterococcus sp. 2201sp1_2201st1_B8_2201SCRN_220225]